MFKRVNIITTRPIKIIRPAILKSAKDVKLSVGDIRRILYSRAKVEEILSDGSTLNLTLENFDKNNDIKVEASVQTKEVKVEAIKEEPAVEEEVKVEDTVEEKTEEVKESNKNNNQNNKKNKR